MIKRLSTLGLFIIFSLTAKGQGDGPHSYLLSPVGVGGVNIKYLRLNQNLVPAGNIYLVDSDINVNLFPSTFFYNFGIKGRFAQVQAMVNPGWTSGSIVTNEGRELDGLENTGLSDGFLAFKIGLWGAPALSIEEFVKHTPTVSVFAYARIWYSGSYDQNQFVNLGTNRLTFEFGVPVNIPIAKSSGKQFWLETYPHIQFFTKNDDPTQIVSGDEVTQDPLFIVENHLSYYLTKKLWAGVDIRYQLGGSLKVDGIDQDNRINALGGGPSLGYQFFSFLNAYVSYGTVFFGENDLSSDMLRASIVLAF